MCLLGRCSHHLSLIPRPVLAFVLLCSLGWPRSHDPTASASQVLGL
jgi:hypothetical protein